MWKSILGRDDDEDRDEDFFNNQTNDGQNHCALSYTKVFLPHIYIHHLFSQFPFCFSFLINDFDCKFHFFSQRLYGFAACLISGLLFIFLVCISLLILFFKIFDLSSFFFCFPNCWFCFHMHYFWELISSVF